MTEKASLLNASIIPKSLIPECFYQGSTVFKNQRRSKNLDSRLKISGMTEGVDSLNASTIPKSLIPEWFYQESKLFKGKKTWIPTSSSPRRFLSRF